MKIETTCHIEASVDVVVARIRALADERQLDDADRAWGRFMGADESEDVEYSVTGIDEETYEVSFREPPFSGVARFEVEPVDTGASTVVESRVELVEAPLALRVVARLPGGRAAARRAVGATLEEWLGEPDRHAPVPMPTVIAHDPTRPARDEPEVRRAVGRAAVVVALGWGAVVVAAVVGALFIRSFVSTEERLDREGVRVEAVVDEFNDDGDGPWVATTGSFDGVEVRHAQIVERTYRVGDTVVLHHDPVAGVSKLADEAYAPDHEFVGYGPVIAAVIGVVLLIEPTYRVLRIRRLLRREPFAQAEIGIRPPVARSHGAMVAVFEPGDRVRVFGAPSIAWPGRTKRVFDELERGCLMAGSGRDRVLWKPGLGRVVRIAQSRFAWRNERWSRR